MSFRSSIFSLFLILVLSGTCNLFTPQSDWARRSFPTDGLTNGIEYKLNGDAKSSEQVNESRMRGVGDFAPERQQLVEFRQMSGTKTEDVTVTLPNGQLALSQGMGKLQRFAGLTKIS